MEIGLEKCFEPSTSAMPFEIQIERAPHGFVAKAARKGDRAEVIVREFTSSEDGNDFIQRLEAISSTILAKLPDGNLFRNAMVDHMLAIIRSDSTATVYLNDLQHTLHVRAKRAVNAGDPITSDHILDVTKVELIGVTVPRDAGVAVIFSVGWRKGLFFDFAPLLSRVPRAYDLESVLGQYYAYLSHQQLFSMSDEAWNVFFRQGWFPFIHLQRATLRLMIDWANAGYLLDDHLDSIATGTKEAVASQIAGWKTRTLFAGHHELIDQAFRKYVEADFVSATAILFPRIEGILRSNHYADPTARNASQKDLVTSTFARAALPKHGYSFLLPERFHRYLREVFFASFDPRNPSGLNRNTVAHGVAPPSAFDRKGATLGFLILLQMTALLPPDETASTTPR